MATTNMTPPRQVIQTRMSDTERWDHVKLRPDDIIVASWGKTGTTLTQQMVYRSSPGDPMTSGYRGVALDRAPRGRPGGESSLRCSRRNSSPRHQDPCAVRGDAVPRYDQVRLHRRDARDVVWNFHNHMLLEVEQLGRWGQSG